MKLRSAQIRDLAEHLDTHRKRQQAQHPKLTLTGMYNVLEKLRSAAPLNPNLNPPQSPEAAQEEEGVRLRLGLRLREEATLSAKERVIHEHGLVTVLRQLHDDLDAAVAAAYALPPTASDDAILTHLCAMNAQRAAEERTGTIRHVRPAFQNPTATATQTTLAGDGMDGTEGTNVPAAAKATAKLAWPKTLAEQAHAVRAALLACAFPTDAATLAQTFKGAKADRVEDLLETLASLGQARTLPAGKYVAA